jgi:glycosyltransferase involved in cell wall biosynthesis
MMHLFLNGLAASAGGGLTYLRNVIPHLAARTDVCITVVAGERLRQELEPLSNVDFVGLESSGGPARRFYWEQNILPELILRSNAEVLISTGNFALRKCPLPQVLLSRNSLYSSTDFSRDLYARRDYRIWFDTRIKGILARRSIRWADCTVAPSEAFAEELRRWSGGKVITIHHGFDHDEFFRDSEPLPRDVQEKLDSGADALRLLFVSHYNYYRNFETLLRALPLLQERLGKKVKLFLTCKLRTEENPGPYLVHGTSALINRLGISGEVVELGTVPYRSLHQVYRACNIYISAAYAESFAHPLVEAMASGLPIVASHLQVHREICGDAALYFDPFSATELANGVLQIAESSDLRRMLSDNGKQRSAHFSWSRHVEEIINLAAELLKRRDCSSADLIH